MSLEKPLSCIFLMQFSISVYSSLTIKVLFISYTDLFCLLEAFLFCHTVKGFSELIMIKRMAAEIQLL